MKKPARPKKVSYELIARDSVVGHQMYALLDELVYLHHAHLAQARIALAWCTSWNADVDGRVKLGMCRKSSDLDRELAAYDFVILLRKFFWQHDEVTPLQRRALLDHELHHAEVKLDGYGEPVEDERGRRVYRTRRHDIEEFTAIVDRYGCWTHEIEAFYAALRRAAGATFEPCATCLDQGTPGWVSIVDDAGVTRQTRCACYLQWADMHAQATREAVAV